MDERTARLTQHVLSRAPALPHFTRKCSQSSAYFSHVPLTHEKLSFCPSVWEAALANEGGYMAIKVACGWAGAVIKKWQLRKSIIVGWGD